MSRKIPLVELNLENVTYAPVTATSLGKGRSAERTTVLHNVSTSVSPYKLTAWMGPSGSGKTSLISVVADLTKPGDIKEGSLITVNGEEGKLPKRLVGVVWQDDLLLSNLTVEENLYFAARLKTSEETSNEEVQNTVEETMKELSLSHIRNSLVGNALGRFRGVSGGERKRVSVGTEMVVQPSLLLLDEPTSGLDATTAQSLVSTLRDLASMGHSIAVVIHQPRTSVYNMFDHLLLLSKGHMIFNGHPSKARTYLESCPNVARLPPETGIADWMMDIIIEDETKGLENRNLIKAWENASVEQPTVAKDIEDESDDSSSLPHKIERRLSSLDELKSVPKYYTSFWTQLTLLTRRTVKQQRGEKLTATALILQMTYLFFTALFWWRMPNNTSWVFERNSLLFFILIAQANGIVVSAVSVFQQERALLGRERAKKMYRVSSYFLAKTISDMTNNVVLPVLYAALSYWTAGFRPTAPAFFKYIFAMYWCFSTAQSMGLYLSVLIPNPQVALVLAPPITLFFMIVGGFYIPFDNMQPVVQWMSYLSFARYSYSSFIVNEYQGRDIPCSGDQAAITIGVGGACPLPGEEVISGLGIDGVTENYWFNVGMVITLQVVFRVAAYLRLLRSK